MSVKINVIGKGGDIAEVFDNALAVTQIPAPVSTSEVLTLPYVQFMTVNGDRETSDLNLDGSTNPITAFIESENDADIYIKELKIVVVDSPALNLSDFGAISGGLANGLVPYFENKGVRLAVSERPIKTNFELLRIGSKSPAFGNDDTAYRIQGAKGGGADYAYFSAWDMTALSAGDLGVRLSAGQGQKLGVVIQDDLLPLTAFDILCIGYRRFI